MHSGLSFGDWSKEIGLRRFCNATWASFQARYKVNGINIGLMAVPAGCHTIDNVEPTAAS